MKKELCGYMTFYFSLSSFFFLGGGGKLMICVPYLSRSNFWMFVCNYYFAASVDCCVQKMTMRKSGTRKAGKTYS